MNLKSSAPKMNLIKWIVNIALRIYFGVTCRIDAPDLHKIPQKGPMIVVTNHTGRIEVPFIVMYLQPRPLTGWAKVESWDNWFLRWIFGVWGAIPVHRGEADMSALKKALRALEQGCFFGIAPEGTRNYTGVLKRAMPGAVVLALHSGAPILPIAHWGGENYLKEFKRTEFHMRVGDVFKIKTEGVKMTGEIRQQIVDEMMREIAKLLPEKYRGAYSDISKEPQYLEKL
jgi:1-acyl-sn-glycerol-3-phosphate acyltransferase